MARNEDDTPGEGHNSAGASEMIKTVIERAERLIEERDTISEDLKELFSEAKGNGLDVKILKKVLARRKRERSEVEQEDTMIELYENQLGVFS